jgi:hypothetical protein
LLFGGRHLGSATDPPAIVTARIDGRELVRLSVTAGFFLRTATIPAGALLGDGAHAPLTVTAASATSGAPPPPVAIEQFDLQPPDAVMLGFAEGWYESEYNPNTRQSWRWMSDKAVVWIHSGGRDINMCLNGESPRKYYDETAIVIVSAGTQELGRFSPDDDFEQCVSVPMSALAASQGRVTVASSLTHVPAERDGVADRRRLGLRIYSVRVGYLEMRSH